MHKRSVVRCVLGGAAAALFVLTASPALAANPANITVSKDPVWGDNSFGPSDHSGDWRPYCAPGTTNIVRWYTGDGTLRSVSSNGFDCAVGMADNASYPQGIPGAISLWNYGSSIIPTSLPHSLGNFGGDGDFYFTITSTSIKYTGTSTNPANLSILKDTAWNDSLSSSLDLVAGWQPYCTPSTTNTVRWFTADGIARSTISNFDCAIGMPDNATYPTGIPGAITLWQFSQQIIPASIAHGSGTGGDGDFYITLTNGNNVVTRYDFGWHSTTTINRFDWSWHSATGYSFPGATSTETFTPVIIIPGILGSAQHNGVWEIDPITHGFDNLIDTLIANGYQKDVTLFTFPYDWHKSNVDTALILKQKINSVKEICHCDKVDLVAHSMGGLVARQYIQSSDYGHDVRKMIFMGTPHLGAPDIYAAWESGRLVPINISNKIENKIIENEAFHAHSKNAYEYVRDQVPSVQQLLPTFNYLVNQGGYTNLRSDYPLEYPRNVFLEDLNTHVNTLFQSGVELHNFVGDLSNNLTTEKIRVVPPPFQPFNPRPLWEDGIPDGIGNEFTDQGLIFGHGDGRVPIHSASFINQNLISLVGNHGEIISDATPIIFKILTDKSASKIVSGHNNLSAKMLILEIFSPADIIIVAPDGKRTGKDFASGQEINEIPDAFYSGFETDKEYVTIPNPLDGEYKIVTQGTGNGGEYILSSAFITDATSTQSLFTGQTLPGLITEHKVSLDIANAGETNIIPSDTVAPTITFSQPTRNTYTHADFMPLNIRFTDETGVSATNTSFDLKPISSSTTIDLFYETLGNHSITASATDFINNSSTTVRNVQIIATFDSVKSDINRAFELKWVSKDLRDDLLGKLTDATSKKKTSDKIEKLKDMLKKLSDAQRDGEKKITRQGFTLLVSDINWLLNSML